MKVRGLGDLKVSVKGLHYNENTQSRLRGF
jgi:hypothetical protein